MESNLIAALVIYFSIISIAMIADLRMTLLLTFKKWKEIISFLGTMIIVAVFLWQLDVYDFTLDSDTELDEKILSNIFDFSAIFSALLITFIISKVFQLKNEKITRKHQVNSYSNKVTNLRRICNILLDNWQIWSDDITEPLQRHQSLRYFDFYKF